MNPSTRAQIEAATVRLPRLGGLGVVVPGQMIVTAAHAVNWDAGGGMMLGDYYVEDVNAGTRALKVQPLAVEPVADVAVLGALDGQASGEFAEAADAFEAFCEATAPVPICTGDFLPFAPFPGHILTHTGRWVDVRVWQTGFNVPVLWIEASEGIEGGTSGGPVVTDDGRLLGVVSNAGGTSGEPALTGKIPRLDLAMPAWLVRKMVDPEWANRKMSESWAIERRASAMLGLAVTELHRRLWDGDLTVKAALEAESRSKGRIKDR